MPELDIRATLLRIIERGGEPPPEMTTQEIRAMTRALIADGGDPCPPDLQHARCLRPEEAAAYVGLTLAALRWHRQRGSGPPFVRYGRAVVYRLPDLDAWITARTIWPQRKIMRRTRDS